MTRAIVSDYTPDEQRVAKAICERTGPCGLELTGNCNLCKAGNIRCRDARAAMAEHAKIAEERADKDAAELVAEVVNHADHFDDQHHRMAAALSRLAVALDAKTKEFE